MARINRPVSRRQSWWLLATAVAAFLPLTPQLPTGLAIAVSVTLLVRAFISWKQWHLPPRWLLLPVTMAGDSIQVSFDNDTSGLIDISAFKNISLGKK